MTFQAKQPLFLKSYCVFLNFANCCKTELQNHLAKKIKLGDKFVTNL